MSTTQIFALLVALTIGLSSSLRAQVQTGSTPQPAPNAPLELPDFLVTGKAVVDIAAGVKQSPQKPARFATSDLDSLNPTEKFPSPTVPNRSLPRFSRERIVNNSYIDGLFGMYTSPMLAAGTSFTAGEYRIDADLDAGYSRDWQPNARILDIGANVSSAYVAPEKFYLFGKGLTETDVSVRHREFTLFATPDAPVRSSTKLYAGISTEAFVGERPIVAHLHWNLHSLQDLDGESVKDQRVHGDITGSIGKRFSASMNIDMQSVAGQSYPYAEAQIARTFGDSLLRFRAALGAQYGASTGDMARMGLLVDVRVDYEPSELFTYGATMRSGLRQVRFSDLLQINPYLSASTLIDQPYDIIHVGLFAKHHPSQRVQIVAGMEFRQTTRSAIWVDTVAGVFDVEYRDVTALSARLEMSYQPTSRDRVLLTGIVQTAVTSSDVTVTYTEPIRLDAAYRRYWTSSLTSEIGLQYVGRRWADLGNSREIDAFLDLHARLSYALGHGMDLVVTADNLVNSTIILWNGYRERGIFVSAGVSWRL